MSVVLTGWWGCGLKNVALDWGWNMVLLHWGGAGCDGGGGGRGEGWGESLGLAPPTANAVLISKAMFGMFLKLIENELGVGVVKLIVVVGIVF